jgi:hypothetical protein
MRNSPSKTSALWRHQRGVEQHHRALSDGSAKSSGVLDRELDEREEPRSIRPSHSMSTLWLVTPEGRPVVLVAAATHGTRLAQEECAPHASTSGLQRSVSRAPAGRRILTGMPIDTG